jgi:hypothetical protein
MWLEVLTGREAGRAVEVGGDELVVGRDRRCDLVLRGDEQVAPRHAVLRRLADGRYEIEDLGARGGTFVAGRRINRPVVLEGCEQLCFGDTFAVLTPAAPRRGGRLRVRLLAAAAVLGLAVVGATAALLAPRTGGGEAERPRLVAASVPRAAPAEPVPAGPSQEPAVAETAPAAVGPAHVVFRDDFSDPGSGWEVFDTGIASAGYENGRLVVRIADPDYFATVDSGRAFKRPVVRVTVGNPGRGTASGFGILCHYRGPARFDLLAVATNGTAAVLRRDGGPLEVVSGGGSWTRSPGVPVGAGRYVLAAECTGTLLRLSVGGRPVVKARAETTGGRIGLFAAGQGELWFDDVAVRASRAGL